MSCDAVCKVNIKHFKARFRFINQIRLLSDFICVSNLNLKKERKKFRLHHLRHQCCKPVLTKKFYFFSKCVIYWKKVPKICSDLEYINFLKTLLLYEYIFYAVQLNCPLTSCVHDICQSLYITSYIILNS